MDKKALLETIKEIARIALFGAVGALVAWLTELEPTATVTIALVVLRSLDKYLHKSGTLNRGLSGF